MHLLVLIRQLLKIATVENYDLKIANIPSTSACDCHYYTTLNNSKLAVVRL